MNLMPFEVTPQDTERFWKKVEKIPFHSCWEWVGARDWTGYGKFWLRPKCSRSAVYTHRFAYASAYGPIPAGRLVCHHCDNRSCVRPDHLFLGDHKINYEDSLRKGRARNGIRNTEKTHCAKGHPYDKQNTGRDWRGDRRCKTCHNLYKRDYLRRKREATS